jgi:hypothetical protein
MAPTQGCDYIAHSGCYIQLLGGLTTADRDQPLRNDFDPAQTGISYIRALAKVRAQNL